MFRERLIIDRLLYYHDLFSGGVGVKLSDDQGSPDEGSLLFPELCMKIKGSNQSSLFELRPDRVKNYDVTLRRLAYESLRLVQNPGIN